MFVLSVIEKLSTLFQSYIQFFLLSNFKNFDPFQKQTLNTSNCYKHYLSYLIIFLFANFYGIYGLGVSFCIFTNLFKLLKTNKLIYIHQIFPFKAWTYSDNVLAIASFNVLFVYVSFLLNNSTNDKFKSFSSRFVKGIFFCCY